MKRIESKICFNNTYGHRALTLSIMLILSAKESLRLIAALLAQSKATTLSRDPSLAAACSGAHPNWHRII